MLIFGRIFATTTVRCLEGAYILYGFFGGLFSEVYGIINSIRRVIATTVKCLGGAYILYGFFFFWGGVLFSEVYGIINSIRRVIQILDQAVQKHV